MSNIMFAAAAASGERQPPARRGSRPARQSLRLRLLKKRSRTWSQSSRSGRPLPQCRGVPGEKRTASCLAAHKLWQQPVRLVAAVAALLQEDAFCICCIML